MNSNEIESLKEEIVYWRTEFERIRKDREFYFNLFQRAFKEIPHSCDNCTQTFCVIKETENDIHFCWAWAGFEETKNLPIFAQAINEKIKK